MAAILLLSSDQFSDGNGVPLASGTITFYDTNTTTLKAIYSDVALSVAIANPATLDASGHMASNVYVADGERFTLLFKDSAGTTISTPNDIWGSIEETDLNVLYTPTDSGAVARTAKARLNDRLSVYDFGAVGDGVYATNIGTDDAVALQAALDSQQPVDLPNGIYLTSVELVFGDNSQLIGSGLYTGVRSSGGEEYDPTRHTIIKYIGAGGSNSTVLRLSETAVGTAVGDLAPPDTDDLSGVRLENLTVDANGLAEFGVYCYRLIDNNIGPVGAMRSTQAGIFIQGSFTNTFNNLIAFSNERNGIEAGRDRYTSWSANERTIHNNTFYRPVARYNGTAKTYDGVSGSFLNEGHGLYFRLGRGNTVIQATPEQNDGAGIFLASDDNALGGPNKFMGGYTEGNMPLVISEGRDTVAYNMIVAYRDDMRHWEFDSYYFSNSNSQDIRIVSSGSPAVPVDSEAFFTLRNCFFKSTGQIVINSNTNAFRVIGCSPVPSYSNSRPGVEEITADGALDIVSPITEITTSSEQVDLTLATAGVPEGFEKTITLIVDGGFDAVITPTALEPSIATITLNSAGDICRLVFLNSKWHVIGSEGGVLA